MIPLLLDTNSLSLSPWVAISINKIDDISSQFYLLKYYVQGESAATVGKLVILLSFVLTTTVIFIPLSKAEATRVTPFSNMNYYAISTSNSTFNLSNPFYIEYRTITEKPAIMNGIQEAKTPCCFSGNGMIKGISFTDTGNASISFGFNATIHIHGQAVITTSTGDRATFIFQEIGHSGADGKTRATGVAFFTANSSTGKLTFLNDVVMIYKTVLDKSGKGMVTGWDWKY